MLDSAHFVLVGLAVLPHLLEVIKFSLVELDHQSEASSSIEKVEFLVVLQISLFGFFLVLPWLDPLVLGNFQRFPVTHIVLSSVWLVFIGCGNTGLRLDRPFLAL